MHPPTHAPTHMPATIHVCTLRYTDRHADGQTDRHAGRQRDRQTDTHACTHTHTHTRLHYVYLWWLYTLGRISTNLYKGENFYYSFLLFDTPRLFWKVLQNFSLSADLFSEEKQTISVDLLLLKEQPFSLSLPLCFQHLSESRFLLGALHRNCKFAKFCHDLMQDHLS